MIKMTTAQVEEILGLSAVSPSTIFQGISIDSRTLASNNLFIAISGEHFDGHLFTNEAQRRGAAALLVAHPVATTLPQMQTANTVLALGQLAAFWRKQFSLPVVAVTGSNGKTTLKNMIASILTSACLDNAGQVLATAGTLNNHYGLPLTLARLDATHRFAVVEMGMNHFGEIEYLSKIARPNIAVITNAAACHLAGVGDLAGVAQAKAEIFTGLAPDGIAILNRDDSYYPYWREKIGQRHCFTFGSGPEAEVRLHTAPSIEDPFAIILTPKAKLSLRLPLLGKHNVHNALAAIAATLALDVPLSAIREGLEQMRPAPGRLQLHQLNNNIQIIDDTYNANPFSLKAAIATLATFPGQKILVLGDMNELGIDEQTMHQKAGWEIRAAGIDYLFTFGELSAHTTLAFGEGGHHFREQAKLISTLKSFLTAHSTILIKGSRSMKMEKVVASLIK